MTGALRQCTGHPTYTKITVVISVVIQCFGNRSSYSCDKCVVCIVLQKPQLQQQRE